MTAIAILGTIFLPAMLVAVRHPFISFPYHRYSLLTKIIVYVQHVNVRLLLYVRYRFRQGIIKLLDVLGSHDPINLHRTCYLEDLDDVCWEEVHARGRVEERGGDGCLEGYPTGSSGVQ